MDSKAQRYSLQNFKGPYRCRNHFGYCFQLAHWLALLPKITRMDTLEPQCFYYIYIYLFYVQSG